MIHNHDKVIAFPKAYCQVFQASNEMQPRSNEERGLRALVLAKTLLAESLKFLRGFNETIQHGAFGADAKQQASRFNNSFGFSQALKELTLAQVQLTLFEQSITNEPWFEEFIAAAAYVLDQLVLAKSVDDILTSFSTTGSRGLCAQVSESILKNAELDGCNQYWSIKDEVQSYLEGAQSTRAKMLAYAMTQDVSILNDYIFTMQLFDE